MFVRKRTSHTVSLSASRRENAKRSPDVVPPYFYRMRKSENRKFLFSPAPTYRKLSHVATYYILRNSLDCTVVHARNIHFFPNRN